jgi:cell division protein ZapA
MERRTVDLVVGGQRYKVVSSASEEELRRLATTVDEKVAASSRGRASSPQTLLLAALALANDLEEERSRRVALEARARDVLRRLIDRVDVALEEG